MKYKEYALLLISTLILLKSVFNFVVPDNDYYETIRGYFEKQAQIVAVMGAQLAQNGIGEALTSAFARSEQEELYQVYSQGMEIRLNGG